MITKTACFSGHRHFPSGLEQTVTGLLDSAIAEAYGGGYRRFLCGGALGFDTYAALRLLAFRQDHPDVSLTMVIPCRDQTDRWSLRDREVYRRICDLADERIILREKYAQGCMLARNRYMVDHSSLCICFLYSFRGGTAYTVRYAVQRKIDVVNLAMNLSSTDIKLRENQWSFISTSRSAEKNAGTAALSPLQGVKLRQKDISGSY